LLAGFADAALQIRDFGTSAPAISRIRYTGCPREERAPFGSVLIWRFSA
jgi:hypothetical protein